MTSDPFVPSPAPPSGFDLNRSSPSETLTPARGPWAGLDPNPFGWASFPAWLPIARRAGSDFDLGSLAEPDEVVILPEEMLPSVGLPRLGAFDAQPAPRSFADRLARTFVGSCSDGLSMTCMADQYENLQLGQSSWAFGKALRDFGPKLRQYRVQIVNGRRYIIFKGYAGLRTYFRGTRYLASNPVLATIGIGSRVAGNAIRGGAISVLIVAGGLATDALIAWATDDQKSLDNLGQTWAPTLTKEVIKDVLAYATTAAIGVLAVQLGVVALPLGATIAIGLAIRYGMTVLEEQYQYEIQSMFRGIGAVLYPSQ